MEVVDLGFVMQVSLILYACPSSLFSLYLMRAKLNANFSIRFAPLSENTFNSFSIIIFVHFLRLVLGRVTVNLITIALLQCIFVQNHCNKAYASMRLHNQIHDIFSPFEPTIKVVENIHLICINSGAAIIFPSV
ncbi:hypothetical protein M9H77_09987 [Catharanthus roseus]|uniref:Uncharacterized protein n=1 Tax=Catharanthus roseus TaxID=4058 RepID=A0ACC0C2B9_CATRO|nr:hypothetical protein M9H77_09987 [Catharanthus roseus]